MYKKIKSANLIQAYIFLEFLGPFLFSLGIFICITITGFVLFNLIDLLVKYGIPLKLFLELFMYSVPEMVFYSIPMSVLLATLLCVSRLYRDNELLAMKMAGRSHFKIFLPLFVFVFIISSFSVLFNEFIVSRSNYELSKSIFYARFGKNLPVAKNNIFYKEYENEKLLRSFYAREFNNGILIKPVIEEFENDELIRIITANKAEFINGSSVFYQGRSIELGEKSSEIRFEKYSFPFLKNLEYLAGEARTPKEMSFAELREYIKLLEGAGEKTGSLEVQLHQKLAIPFTGVVFLLIGIPLGLGKKSKNSSFGFAFSIVFIFVFYFIMFLFTALGSINVLNPLLSAWLPNIIFLAAGSFLFLKERAF